MIKIGPEIQNKLGRDLCVCIRDLFLHIEKVVVGGQGPILVDCWIFRKPMFRVFVAYLFVFVCMFNVRPFWGL